jgi:hypothetical protein
VPKRWSVEAPLLRNFATHKGVLAIIDPTLQLQPLKERCTHVQIAKSRQRGAEQELKT